MVSAGTGLSRPYLVLKLECTGPGQKGWLLPIEHLVSSRPHSVCVTLNYGFHNNQCHYLHLAEEETQAWKTPVTCPKACNQEPAVLGAEPKSDQPPKPFHPSLASLKYSPYIFSVVAH